MHTVITAFFLILITITSLKPVNKIKKEMVIVIWLSIELSLRVWSAGCRSRYQTWRGRLKFMKNAFCILGITL